MKSLKESIFDSVEDIVNNDTVLIEQFLKDNYEIDGTYEIRGSYTIKTIKDNVVDVRGQVKVKNKNIESLTNGAFRFGVVSWDFWCTYCSKLTSLEGAPKEVEGDFYCTGCDKLTSLKGSPKRVGERFDCSYCKNLTSLKRCT